MPARPGIVRFDAGEAYLTCLRMMGPGVNGFVDRNFPGEGESKRVELPRSRWIRTQVNRRESRRMRVERAFMTMGLAMGLLLSAWVVAPAAGQAAGGGRPEGKAANASVPEIAMLMREVQEHQKRLEKVRENYTYSSTQTTQEMDGNGQVKKTETEEAEDFFVNGHAIERKVKKNGQPLNEHDEKKETERVTRLVEKAQKTPPDQPLDGQTIRISRLLEIMDVRNPRRETFRGRATIVFDFVGRKDAKTHGMVEDASKKMQGTMWVDEADREIAHLEVSFDENFHVAGGLVANIQKGSNFRFDQAPVNGDLWLPTGGEGTMQARVLLVKSFRMHFVERDYDYKRFHVDAEPGKDAKLTPEAKP